MQRTRAARMREGRLRVYFEHASPRRLASARESNQLTSMINGSSTFICLQPSLPTIMVLFDLHCPMLSV